MKQNSFKIILLNIIQNILFIITICLLLGIRFVDNTLSVGVIFMYILFIFDIVWSPPHTRTSDKEIR